MSFQFNTCGRMREIFAGHCNMSLEQYEEISRRFIELVQEYRDGIQLVDIEKEKNELRVIFDFLYNTKELSLTEHSDLCGLCDEIEDAAIKQLGGMDYGKLVSMIGGNQNQEILRKAAQRTVV